MVGRSGGLRLERVGPGPLRTRDDLPGGASRLYAEATGIEHVLVNGTDVVTGDRLTGALPGRVLPVGRRHPSSPGTRPLDRSRRPTGSTRSPICENLPVVSIPRPFPIDAGVRQGTSPAS